MLGIAGPLIVNNLSIAGMQFADAVMAGRLGAESLAAVAVGGSVWFLGFTMALGVLMAISPIAARHHGAGNLDLIGRYTRQGIYLGIAIAIPIMVMSQLYALDIMTALKIDLAFREMTAEYLRMITLGAVGMFIFLALRSRPRASVSRRRSCTRRSSPSCVTCSLTGCSCSASSGRRPWGRSAVVSRAV